MKLSSKNYKLHAFFVCAIFAANHSIAQETSKNHQAIEISKEADALKERSAKKTFLGSQSDQAKPITLNNYVLNKRVTIPSPKELTALQGGQFVPQTDVFLDLYMKFIGQGMSPMEAIMMVHVSPEAMDVIKKSNELKNAKN
jgi:hypothetical protein